MVQTYLKKARYRIFPDIKDWTLDQDHLRYKKVNDMRWIEWFWFHHTAFTLMKKGIPVIGIINFGIAALLFLKFSSNLYGVAFCSLMELYCLYMLFKANKELKLAGKMNFYDLYLRDYKIRLN